MKLVLDVYKKGQDQPQYEAVMDLFDKPENGTYVHVVTEPITLLPGDRIFIQVSNQ